MNMKNTRKLKIMCSLTGRNKKSVSEENSFRPKLMKLKMKMLDTYRNVLKTKNSIKVRGII